MNSDNKEKLNNIKCPICKERLKTVFEKTYYGGGKCFFVCSNGCLEKDSCEEYWSDEYS